MDVKTYTASEISEMHEDCSFRLSQIDASVREEQHSVSAMDDLKFITHADYRALEERYEALKVTEREGYAEYHRTRVELASIKARVESMQDRIDAYQEKGLIQ